MSGEQATLGQWAPEPHGRREDLDDDPTPRGVVRAVLTAALGLDVLRRRVCFSGSRVLDLGSGFGCWPSELRRLALEQGWEPHITGVEINPEREPHLRKWCDEVVIDGYREFMGVRDAGRSALGPGHPADYDLIMGNPPFAELLRCNGEFPRDEAGALDPSQTMLGICLEHAPAVLFLHTQQAFVKSEMGRAVQRAYPPAASWQIPGGVSFRGDGKADSRCYEATLWLRGHTGPCSRYLLPELTAAERRWTVPPGSESPDEARALHGRRQEITKHPDPNTDRTSMLKNEIQQAINRASRESESGTPDYILAQFLLSCLEAYEKAVAMRDAKAEIDRVVGE